MTQDKWTQAMITAIDAVKTSTVEGLMNNASNIGFIKPVDEALDENIGNFLKGLAHAFVDMRSKMCEDIDKSIDQMLKDGW